MTHLLTMQHFLNSLLLETSEYQIKDNCIHVDLNSHGQLEISLTYVSASGRHRYSGKVLLRELDKLSQIPFSQAASLLVDRYFPEVDKDKKTLFLQRVENSNDYVKRASSALALRQSRHDLQGFITSEQALSGGHSMHPAPKCNEPLNQQEQEAYLPEFAGEFAVEWFAVKEDKLAGEYVSGSLKYELKEMFLSCHTQGGSSLPDAEWVPIPMHPLQAREWRKAQANCQVLQVYTLDLGLKSDGWTATSSSRAIYHPNCKWMLKVSLPVRLTNSLRLMTEPEARRGTQFSKLMKTAAGEELKQRLNFANFIEEPMWCSIVGQDQAVLDLPLVCFRVNPFFVEAEQVSDSTASRFHMLATLNQDAVGDKTSELEQWIRQCAQIQGQSLELAARHWMSSFIEKVIAPICVARADYGIVMLAHQQNLMVEVEQGLPVGVAVRDCQGFGLTSLAMDVFSDVLEREQPEYFMEAGELNPYHAYYVIGNSLLNTIAAIGALGFIEETDLWALCRNQFDALSKLNPKDDTFYHYILNSPTLRWKRNFMCFLSAFNEATMKDPSIIYCEVANPLAWKESENEGVRIHKPLPSGRTVTILDRESSDGALTFSLIEYGEVVAQFNAEREGGKTGALTCNTTDINDSILWWSAVEHTFFSMDLNRINVTNWPGGEKTIEFSEFLESAPIWLHTAQDSNPLVFTTAENGSTHPVRPDHPEGIVFQRYYYHLKRTVTLRVIDIARDLNTFHRWHNEPSVAQMWELEGELSTHRNYLEQQKQDKHAYGVIGEFDGVPFGYFEIYWAAEDRIGPFYEYGLFDKGVHMLVGNLAYRGLPYFDTWGRAVVQYCFMQEPRMESVVGEPRADNHRVLKLNSRVGMQKLFEFDFPHKRSAFILCGRKRFFEQFAF